ncbi:hypothetical protein D3C73_1239390 [compost metagenome]
MAYFLPIVSQVAAENDGSRLGLNNLTYPCVHQLIRIVEQFRIPAFDEALERLSAILKLRTQIMKIRSHIELIGQSGPAVLLVPLIAAARSEA